MTVKRRRVWWLSAALAPAVLAAGAGVALWRAQEPATRLTVKIVGVPGNARPTVVVAGADGFKRSVTASATLKVPAGSVRVTPAPIKAAHVTYYAPDDVLTVAVQRGESRRLVVDYQIAISDKARILNYAKPGLVSPPKGSKVFLRADAPNARDLHAGDILLAAEGPQTPKGLLRRVVRVEHRGSVLAVETAPAKLKEAMPKAVLRFPTAAERATPAAYMVPAAYVASDPNDPHLEPDVSLSMDTWKGKGKAKDLACGIGLPLFKAEMDWPQVDFAGTDLGFNEKDLVWAQLQARIQYSMKTTWGTPHAAQCAWNKVEDTKWNVPGWAAQLVRVGPFTVHPKLQWLVGMEAKAATGVKLESQLQDDFTVKTRLSLRPWASAHVENNGPAKHEAHMAGATEGTLKGKLGFRVKVEAAAPIDVFTAGLNLDVAPGVEGSLEPFDRKAEVGWFLEGGVGMEVKAGEFAGREIGASIPLYKHTIWESELPPTLAFATNRTIELKTGTASPDIIARVPAGMAVRQLTWSPDGKRLAWTTAPTGTGGDKTFIYLADLATGEVDRWPCFGCRISFTGNELLSEWMTLTGQHTGFARYRIGETEPSAVDLANPEVLHQGLTDDEAMRLSIDSCGSGGCATMDLFGGAGSPGDTLIGIPWSDCRTKIFRVNSRLQASALTVANADPDTVAEPGPDGRLLLSGMNYGGCGNLGKPVHLELSEVAKNGQSSTVPVPPRFESWDVCYLWYDDKGGPHAVVAPPIDDSDVSTREYPCFQHAPRTFEILKKQGTSWQQTSDTVLLRKTSGKWSAELHVGGRLAAEHSRQRIHVSEHVRTFAWSPQAG